MDNEADASVPLTPSIGARFSPILRSGEEPESNAGKAFKIALAAFEASAAI